MIPWPRRASCRKAAKKRRVRKIDPYTPGAPTSTTTPPTPPLVFPGVNRYNSGAMCGVSRCVWRVRFSVDRGRGVATIPLLLALFLVPCTYYSGYFLKIQPNELQENKEFCVFCGERPKIPPLLLRPGPQARKKRQLIAALEDRGRLMGDPPEDPVDFPPLLCRNLVISLPLCGKLYLWQSALWAVF